MSRSGTLCVFPQNWLQVNLRKAMAEFGVEGDLEGPSTLASLKLRVHTSPGSQSLASTLTKLSASAAGSAGQPFNLSAAERYMGIFEVAFREVNSLALRPILPGVSL